MNKTVLRRIKSAITILLNGNTQQSQNRENIPSITLDEVDEAKTFFPLPKFFVYGHARSGTTLLARMMSVHPDVYCGYQAHFFTKDEYLNKMFNSIDAENWLTKNSNHWNRKKDLTPVVMRSICDYMMEREARKLGAKIVGDKSPNSILNGEAVINTHRVYPDAKIIYIIRDGRETLLSHRFQQFIDRPQHLNASDQKILRDFAKDAEPYFMREKSIFSQKVLEEAAVNWVENVTGTINEMERLYENNNHVIKYEDLLSNPFEEIRKVWDFLAVDDTFSGVEDKISEERNTNHSIEWQMQKSPKLAENLIRLKRGTWSDLFTTSDVEIFSSIAGDTLNQWGYKLQP